MTSFREAADAIRRPLSFALRGDEAAASVHDLEGTLRAALLAASQLWIPPEARKRLSEAAERLEGGTDPAGLAWIAKRLAPLLDPEFPARMLAQPASRVPGVGPKTASDSLSIFSAVFIILLVMVGVRLPSKRTCLYPWSKQS